MPPRFVRYVNPILFRGQIMPTTLLLAPDFHIPTAHCVCGYLKVSVTTRTLLFYLNEPIKNGVSLILPSSIARDS